MTSEEIKEKVEETGFTFGVFPIMDLLCRTDSRLKFFKCTKCGGIFKQ